MIAIPIFDHEETIGAVVDSVEPFGLRCLIVDDGSGPATKHELRELEERHAWVDVVHHEANQGRGAALRTAYRTAARSGATHVIQIDADGQHAAADVPLLLEAAQKHPEALILGAPIFDDSVPFHRLHGRKLSKGIVWLETLSDAVEDPLCGFRCMPLGATLAIVDRVRTGDRMDFDPEIVIRLVRADVDVVNVPTRVVYPEQGRSHFRMVRDNLLIAAAYVRLAVEPPWRRVKLDGAR